MEIRKTKALESRAMIKALPPVPMRVSPPLEVLLAAFASVLSLIYVAGAATRRSAVGAVLHHKPL